MPARPSPDAMPGDVEWRLEVGRTRAAHPRRTLPLTVNIGWPAGDRVSATAPWPLPQEYDAGLRFDVLDALLEQWEEVGEAAACGWLTRPGLPSLHDEDLLWLAATFHACAAREVELVTFRAVTRTGWLDVVSGESRVWRRLRV